jgi:hypothetical protein
MGPYFSVFVGIVLLYCAFAMDSGDCGGRVMSPSQECTTVHLGQSRSYTRNYDEQHQLKNMIRVLGFILSGIFLFSGVVQIFRRAAHVRNDASGSARARSVPPSIASSPASPMKVSLPMPLPL